MNILQICSLSSTGKNKFAHFMFLQFVILGNDVLLADTNLMSIHKWHFNCKSVPRPIYGSRGGGQKMFSNI